MQEIDTIYYNNYGVAFKWKRGAIKYIGKIQLVFRDMGFLLSNEELGQFLDQIKKTKKEGSQCANCPNLENCRELLLETPLNELSLVVSIKELCDLVNLLEGTIFQLNLDNLIDGVCDY